MENLRHMQVFFNPVNYHFRWTENWYEWDSKAAHKEALKQRNKKVKQLRSQGWKVRPVTITKQLISRGGIGSDHPHIEVWANVYGFNADRVEG